MIVQCPAMPADLLLPEHEKEHLYSVDDVRREINETVRIRPYGGGRKVYVVRDAGLMNEQAENALLKTLEEPPEYVTILLSAETESGFLDTILSRTVRFTLTGGGEASESSYTGEMLAFLKKGEALTAFDAIGLSRTLAGEKGKNTGSAALRLRPVFDLVRTWFRDVMVLKEGGRSIVLSGEEKELKADAKRLPAENINRILLALCEAEERLESNTNTEGTIHQLLRTILKEYEVIS